MLVLILIFKDDNSWIAKKLPSAKSRYAHTTSVVGPWLFIFGGCDGAEWVGELDMLNLTTLEWMKINVGGEGPTGRGHHTAVFFDSRLFFYGGSSDNDVFDDLYILELGSQAYLPLQPTRII